MNDTPSPDWGNFPCLDGVGEKADVRKKGPNADYVNWAKVLRILRHHARGWVPGFKTWLDSDGIEQRVYPEKDGTGSVIVFFRAPTGSGFLDTEEFCQPIIQGNRAMKIESISSLHVTNAIKRGWCAAAGAHFGLFSELWSKDPLECPYENEELAAAPIAPPKPPAKPPAKPKGNTATQPEQVATKEEPSTLDTRRDKCTTKLRTYFTSDKDAYALWSQALKNRFDGAITADKPTPAHCTTDEQVTWLEQWIDNYAQQVKK